MKGEKVSGGERGAQTTDSVFDFLYHDSRRIASYLSQFDNNGTLTGITASEGVTKGAKRGKRIGFGGNTPVGGGNLELEIGPGEAGSEGLVRAYDPFWANALQFLDVLSERNMIQRDLESANIGQFVLVSGFLSIQDLAMMKDAWKTNSLQRTMLGGSHGGKKVANMTAAQKAAAKEEKENTEMFLDMIQIMPHSVHARLLTSGDKTNLIWCAVNQDHLVMPPSDITLTYGNVMSGQWSILGILSAQPEYLTPDLDGKFDETNLGLTESIVGQLTKILSPIVRVALGRPSAAFAVTPLLIFRELT